MTTVASNRLLRAASICALCAVVFAAAPASAGGRVNVWVDTAWDVFPSYDDVAISLRVDRDSYAAVFLVDTEGYVHVVYPSSTAGRARLHSRATYRYRACDLGLDALRGRGIAYVFAATSPYPFDFSAWGGDVFVGRYGYRVHGDPYVACGEFLASLLPAGCDWDRVGVGCARFYIGEWVRYPSYLCAGAPGSHVRVGDYCRVCAGRYDHYRAHVAAPHDVIRGAGLRHAGGTERTSAIRRSEAGSEIAASRRSRNAGKTVTAKRLAPRVRVVSTSHTVRSSRRRGASVEDERLASARIAKHLTGGKGRESSKTR